MSINLKMKFSEEEDMLAYIFRFGLQHDGKRLVVAEDDIIRKELIDYLSVRKATATEHRDIVGFCIYKKAPENIEKYSCAIEVCGPNEGISLQEISAPCLTAVLDPGTNEPDNYWTARNTDTGSYDYPRANCFLMNSDLKPLFLNTFVIAENEIDIICPWINRHVVNEEFVSLLHKAISRGVKIS